MRARKASDIVRICRRKLIYSAIGSHIQRSAKFNNARPILAMSGARNL
jgi:hypothetical protein